MSPVPPVDPLIPAGLSGLLEQLATALLASRVHPPSHPAITRPVALALQLTQSVLQDSGADALTLIARQGQLLFQGRSPVPTSLPASRLLEILGRWKAAGLRIVAGLGEAELSAFLRLVVRPDGAADLAGLAAAASRAGCRRIGLIATAAGPSRASGPVGRAPARVEALRDAVVQAFTNVAAGAGLDFAGLARCAEAVLATIDGAARADGEVLDLALRDEDDPIGALHALRVCGLTMVAARSITRDQELLVRLGRAALLHDVGQLLLPLDLLQAGEPEDELSAEHPALGAEYLLSHDDVDPLAVAVAFGHHRTASGAGYPATAHEHQVSRFTQLVRIADQFEALTARQPQRPALSPVRAYRTLLTGDHGIDLGLLRRFVDAQGIHPIGAVVGLDSGETAQVVRPSAEPGLPIVRILEPGRAGVPCGGLIDLSRPRAVPLRIVPTAAAR
jgi:HD-GYP domain-containing protein (c-di-GMP phosphodiesterase class II)